MIDPEVQDMIKPELNDGEELLWAGRRYHEAERSPLISQIIGWSIFIGWIMACSYSAYRQWAASEQVYAVLWGLGALLAIWLLVMVKLDAKPENRKMVYGITEDRLIAINSDNEIQSVTGRPFYSISTENALGGHKDIYLFGPGIDDNIFSFNLLTIDHADIARKLIEAQFMRQKEKTS